MKEIFRVANAIYIVVGSVAQMGCFFGVHTAAIDLGFKWLFPIYILLCMFGIALVVNILQLLIALIRGHAHTVNFGFWHVIRVFVWILSLYFTTILSNGL